MLRDTTHREWLTYAIVWLLIFLTPLVSLYAHASFDRHVTFRWVDVLHIWSILLVMLVIFLVHNIWLAPLLLRQRRKRAYLAGMLVLLTLFAVTECNHLPPPRPQAPPPDLEAPAGNQAHIPPPPRPARLPERVPPLRLEHMMGLVMMVLIFGANVGVKYMFMGMEADRQRQQREREMLKHELAYLKYQMNPHFFMNTLNNIHALVDIDPERAKKCVVELSQMMRYMLYECDKDTVPLSRGIDILRNYIALMRIRYDDQVDITLTTPNDMPNVELPPLLIIPFVENAFKHGVSYARQSFIHIDIATTGRHIVLRCDNSRHPDDESEHGGAGIPNVVKRLDLIYGNRYQLDVDEQPDHYLVTLRVPMDMAPPTPP
ncbi:MAG: histidine kinase [Muribaculaceae bacterium]|nr:histidine kinase [Muribaculaceae bacterium]